MNDDLMKTGNYHQRKEDAPPPRFQMREGYTRG